MTTDASHRAGDMPGLAQVPLSALEHYEYCPRQAGLILLEDGYADDMATVRRALPVWHDGLGLTGVCDAVEIHKDGQIVPVEHKSGDYQPGGPADVQLAGQAICLEEMFGTPVHAGAIFSASDRRRHQVQISSHLRQRVAASTLEVREILGQERLPPAVSDRRCRRCSMSHICLPRVLAGQRAFARAAASLFTVASGTDGQWDD